MESPPPIAPIVKRNSLKFIFSWNIWSFAHEFRKRTEECLSEIETDSSPCPILARWPPNSDFTRWLTRRARLNFKNFSLREFLEKWLLELSLKREPLSCFSFKLINLPEKSAILWGPRKYLQYFYSEVSLAKYLSRPRSDGLLHPCDFQKAFLAEEDRKRAIATVKSGQKSPWNCL